jgi:RNA polymerase sigma factor (sigma-70 family)
MPPPSQGVGGGGSDPPQEGGHAAVEAAWRLDWPRLVAALTRLVGDIDLAEDLAQDALVAALQEWPRDGVPPRPGAWLMVTARHRALDRLRRDRALAAKYALLGPQLLSNATVVVAPSEGDSMIPDDRLRMIFTACHPVLTPPARVALTLRLVGGLTVEEIARTYFVPASTIAQRIVRAKRTIATQHIAYAVPDGPDLAQRLDSVLEVVCLIFTEGHAASGGDRWLRLDLVEEGLRLARVLARLMPDQPEVHGLAALLELQASRVGARTTPDTPLVLLSDQDRSAWDQLLIRRGFVALQLAHALNTRRGQPPGRFALQAAIAAEHAIARSAEHTNWPRLATLYTILATRYPSPIVRLNQAVAVAMANGPSAGLALVDDIAASGDVDGYHLLHAVRGDLLARLGRHDEASVEFERAATLTANVIEQRWLRERVSQCKAQSR